MRRAAGAVAAALCLVLVALAPGTALATPEPLPSPTAGLPEPETPVEVLVSTLAPRAPTPGGQLRVAGTLRNLGSSPVDQMRVALRVGDRIDSRSGLALADEEGVPTRRVESVTQEETPLPPGGTRPFTVTVDVDDLPLRQDGAYPLEVEVRGRVDGGDRGEIVGLASTFLPWFATPPTGTTRLAFVWPLVADPVQAPRRTQEGTVVLDDALARDLAEDGRLWKALKAARGTERLACDTPAVGRPAATCRREPVPLTYALDGDLLDTAAGMAEGYQVRQSEERLRAGTGRDAAAAWMASLREGASRGDVVALPYADPDVVALTGSGSALAADVRPALQLGRRAVALRSGETPLPAVTLTPGGALTVDALQAYAGAGTRTLLVSEDALPPRPPTQGQTLGARSPLPTATGPLAGLVVDDGLSRLLAPDTEGPGWQGARLAEQRWLVESAMVSAEAPDATRTLVVAPARDADLVPAVAAQAALDAGRLPWLCPVPLADVVEGRESCPLGGPVGAADEERGAPVVPADDAPALSEEQVEDVERARRGVDQLTSAVLAPSEEASDTRARLLRAAFRAESAAWRRPEAQRRGRQLADLLQDDVDDLLGRVKLLTTDTTLTSARGRLTVAVENQLDQAVTVRVELTADNAARLAVQGAGVVEVPARTSLPVTLDAEPRTSGQFPVSASLRDRTGAPFGTPSGFVLRSTRYGSVALAVTGVAAGVLLVAAGFRLTKRALGR